MVKCDLCGRDVVDYYDFYGCNLCLNCYSKDKELLIKELKIEDKIYAEKRSLSEWIQFLGIKASLRNSQFMGISSIFIVGFIGIITIYNFINDIFLTIIGASVILIVYYLIISKYLHKLSSESQMAEKLLDDIMNGKINEIDQIKERWFKKENSK